MKINIQRFIYLVAFFLLGGSFFIASSQEKKQLTTDEQRKFDYFYYEAINAKATEEYGAAYDYLNYCLQIDSTNAAVLYELGNFHNSLEDKSKAYDFYKKAVQYNPDNFYYNTAYAMVCLEIQQYNEAIEVYERIIPENPSKIDLYLYLSEAYRLDGDLPKAIEALDKLETIVGLNEKISLQKFQLYSVLDEKKSAYAEFQKYIDEYPEEIKYYILLGNVYLQENLTEEAFSILSKAKEIDPDNPYLITAMASYYEQTNNKEAAEKELNTALLSEKLDIDTKLGILAQYVGTLQQNENGTERANSLFEKLMELHPQEPSLNFMYGNLLMLQDKPTEARFQFHIFAESEPTNPMGWEQLLRTVPNDSIDLTIEICETALTYLPNEPLFYFYLGIAQYQKDEHDKALLTFTQGANNINEDTNRILSSEIYGMMGSLYFEENEEENAFTAFDKSLQYNPQNILVLNNYSYYLSLKKKDLEKAEKMSSITIKAEPTNPTYLDTYGWVLFVQGAYVTAKIYLENAVKYSMEKEGEASAEVLEHYGDVLFKTGEEEEAVEYWIKAKEKGSDSETLEEKISTKTYIAK